MTDIADRPDTTDTTGPDAAQQLIATWTPRSGSPTPHALEWVRATVAAAGPRDVHEARRALRYALAYAEHLVAAGTPLDAAAVFAPEQVDTYRTTAMIGAKGSRWAASSFLKRLHPDVGLAGTTRHATDTDADEPADEPVRDTEGAAAAGTAPAVVVVSDEVDDVIAGYVPATLDPARWAIIADLVRTAVRRCAPARPGRARDLCRCVAYLAAWAHATRRPLRTDTILAASTIEAFIAVLDSGDVPARSTATFASNLHAVREAHGLPLDVERRRFPAASPRGPYDTAEVDAFYATAAIAPRRARRRHLTAALDLILGAGAFPKDAAAATPDDVSVDGAGCTLVRFADRTVPVLDDHAQSLLDCADEARAAGDQWLIGGGVERRQNRLSELFGSPKSPQWAIPFEATRGRTTWLIAASLDPGRYGGPLEFLDHAGLACFTSLDRIADAMRAARDARRCEHIEWDTHPDGEPAA